MAYCHQTFLKKQYSRIWSQFRDFVSKHDFELAPPAEDSFSLFFNFLKQKKKFASSTLYMNLLLLFLGVLCIVYCVCVLCSGAGDVIANM